MHESRSDSVPVAVGFSPRYATPDALRRVATPEETRQASLRDAKFRFTQYRGLKPSATSTASLGDGATRANFLRGRTRTLPHLLI